MHICQKTRKKFYVSTVNLGRAGYPKHRYFFILALLVFHVYVSSGTRGLTFGRTFVYFQALCTHLLLANAICSKISYAGPYVV